MAKTPETPAPATMATGVLFVAPDGEVLLLKRAGTEANFSGHWALPGGKAEPGETPAQAAHREAIEETGFGLDSDNHNQLDSVVTPTGMAFHTFICPVTEKFQPKLADAEHTHGSWYPPDQLPEPVHPAVLDLLTRHKMRAASAAPAMDEFMQGVQQTSQRIKAEQQVVADAMQVAMKPHLAADAAACSCQHRDAEGECIEPLAFDRGARAYDQDGHMKLARTPVSKAGINEYYGREIPNAERLGLSPTRRYKLLRDPEELKRGAITWDGKPLLLGHKPVHAQDHAHEMTVGAVGTGATYEHPYLFAPLSVWDGGAIDSIERGDQKQLSSAYHYRADMTPGTYEGQAYDGVMRDLRANHVALVRTGRAGPDVVVQDEAPQHPINFGAFKMSKPAVAFDAFKAKTLLAKDGKPAVAFDAFEENKHPRANNGQFGAGEGASHEQHWKHHDAQAGRHLRLMEKAAGDKGASTEARLAATERHLTAAEAQSSAAQAHKVLHRAARNSSEHELHRAHEASYKAHMASSAALAGDNPPQHPLERALRRADHHAELAKVKTKEGHVFAQRRHDEASAHFHDAHRHWMANRFKEADASYAKGHALAQEPKPAQDSKFAAFAQDAGKFTEGKHDRDPRGKFTSSSTGHTLDYSKTAKLKGFNGAPDVHQAHTEQDRAHVLIKTHPHLSRAHHAALSQEHAELKKHHDAEWNKTYKEAANATWGRDPEFGDYRVSGIGSSEFSEEHKDKLRHHAHSGTYHGHLDGAHATASMSRMLPKAGSAAHHRIQEQYHKTESEAHNKLGNTAEYAAHREAHFAHKEAAEHAEGVRPVPEKAPALPSEKELAGHFSEHAERLSAHAHKNRTASRSGAMDLSPFVAEDAGKFQESKHPRAKDGKFGAGVGKSHQDHAEHHSTQAQVHMLKRNASQGSERNSHRHAQEKHTDATIAHRNARDGSGSAAEAHAASAAAHQASEYAAGAGLSTAQHEFVKHLDGTLIPDTKEAGMEFTADDLDTASHIIKTGKLPAGHKYNDTVEEFVDYLEGTLIPDYEESGSGYAGDFKDAVKHIRARTKIAQDAGGKFDEMKHPRNKTGQFGEKAGTHDEYADHHLTMARGLEDQTRRTVGMSEHVKGLKRSAAEAHMTAFKAHEHADQMGGQQDQHSKAAYATSLAAHHATTAANERESLESYGAGSGKTHAEHDEYHAAEAEKHEDGISQGGAAGHRHMEAAEAHHTASMFHRMAKKYGDANPAGGPDKTNMVERAYKQSKAAHEASKRAAAKPLSDSERTRAEELTKKTTAFKSFDEMARAEGGYRPSMHVDKPEMKELADHYDRHQEYSGDPRRAFRYGKTVDKATRK